MTVQSEKSQFGLTGFKTYFEHCLPGWSPTMGNPESATVTGLVLCVFPYTAHFTLRSSGCSVSVMW